jgi:hypothetical protein
MGGSDFTTRRSSCFPGSLHSFLDVLALCDDESLHNEINVYCFFISGVLGHLILNTLHMAVLHYSEVTRV